ncbi:LLM class flavin-dependent oxidoreductase [Paracoccus aerodenitrificans]|uniref:LLM class flavin-dependent oxidoreductase n=1 Tax=Paracoccus aerodenitrificans TaxID=3017781 RepID=UPI0022F0157C|nr:LLM class flavin-dependent oxidoreductase [Paracoccus aerodenitrificans]WBU64117.1 LLM class flavin-dependent oxidoreductase [Paracoccus aerodenitrificans]
MRYSILDLAPVPEGFSTAEAIANSVSLAQMADGLNYHRYWLAEHHNMIGIASAATSVLIGHIAGQTSRIRVGAGGIMLPNHSPLSIAEQFGTLATIYGDRIDLGLGRAPGGDGAVFRALRKTPDMAENFPQDVAELMSYLDEGRPGAQVMAHPGQGTHVPIWMLGSSLFGAQLAAVAGLPYAFASHFAPTALSEALRVYRERFEPAGRAEAENGPHFMLAVNVIAAETDDEAHYLHSSQKLAFARLRSGKPGKLPQPTRDLAEITPPLERMVGQALSVSAVGGPATVRQQLSDLIAQYRPDELILTGQIHDPEARRNSYRLAAEILDEMSA